MKNLETISLEYLAQGLSIIPTHYKRPLVSWKKYQKELPSKQLVKWWFKNLNPNGIAVITGKVSSLIVIDIDPKNGGDINSLSDETPTVLSGGGGKHLYYKASNPEDYKSLKPPGYDIQGEGSYVIAPPSIHQSGKSYKWIIPFDRKSLKSFPIEFKKSITPPNINNDVVPSSNKQIFTNKTNISKEGKRQIKSIPILEVISNEGFIPIEVGQEKLVINCPFHLEKTPSCTIHTDTNRVHCYGCEAHYDSIEFIKKLHGISYLSACRHLKQRFL